ncbi:hypothetical protein C818_04096 [Lachnospiraceae bacterium MD308]|nr:hypothetical protein C818_04096 [Lachnospiraceae bacterium MD308]
MGMYKRRTLLSIMVFVIMWGCFAGINLTVKAAAFDTNISPDGQRDDREEVLVTTAATIPIYHSIPPYQQKDLYAGATVKIKGLTVEEIVDGKANGETRPYTDAIRFKIYNSTKQKVEQVVEAKNGRLPDITLVDNHTYIIFSQDADYKVVRDDGNTQYKLSKNAYIWVKNGKIYDIKEGADAPYNYPEFKKIQVTQRTGSDLPDDDRVPLYLPVQYKGSGISLRNVKLKLVSDVETIETSSGDSGRLNVQVLEDVNYIITVDSDEWDIEAFPLAAKDKSEYRTDKGRPGERYFYDHSDCHQVLAIELVNKKDAHKNDKKVTSLSGNTTVSGFDFKDFLVMEKKLNKNLVKGLEGKDYDILNISAVNPHRWEISKLAAGNFNITEKTDTAKKVNSVYYIDGEGGLRPLDFSETKGAVSFTMNSMSIHPVVIVYDKIVQKAEAQKTAVQKITVSGISKSIAAGKKIQLKADIIPSNAENKAVVWESTNSKYASVDSNGKVTAKKAGGGKSVEIIATARDGSGKQGVYKIKIMKNAVKSISLKAKRTLKAGKKVAVKATVKTTGKSANKKLQWLSSDTRYATVNSKGKVTAKKAGKGKKVKITAKATDGSGKKKTITIKIK